MKIKKRNLLLAPVLLVAAENLFLTYYADPLVERQDSTFEQVIAGLGPPQYPYNPQDWTSQAYDCITKPIVKVYTYEICIIYGRPDPAGKQGYRLRVTKPGPYLTPFGWNDPDRHMRRGKYILLLDEKRKLKNTLSSN